MFMHVLELQRERRCQTKPIWPFISGACLFNSGQCRPWQQTKTLITCSFGKGHSEGLSGRGNSPSSMKHNEGSTGRTKLASAVSDSPFSSVMTNRMLNNSLNDTQRQFWRYINTFWIKVREKKTRMSRILALHHLLTNRSSAVNGCRQNESPNS